MPDSMIMVTPRELVVLSCWPRLLDTCAAPARSSRSANSCYGLSQRLTPAGSNSRAPAHPTDSLLLNTTGAPARMLAGMPSCLHLLSREALRACLLAARQSMQPF